MSETEKIRVVIRDFHNCHFDWFLLKGKPRDGDVLPLKNSKRIRLERINGVYRLLNVKKPPKHLEGSFDWEVQVERIRDLNREEVAIPVEKYD